MTDYGGHVEPGGPVARRVLHTDDTTIGLTKLSVGPMDNNCYVLRDGTTDHAVVIDAAAEPDRILEVVADATVDAVVTTHGHRDHWQALAEVAGTTSAAVCHHAGDADAIPVAADHHLAHEATVPLGRASLRVLHTPGHTGGSICLLLRARADDRPASRLHLFTGDTLFPGGPGRTEDADAFARIMRSLRRRLFTLDDDTWVYPGHGDDTTLGAERPHLDAWQERGW